jgi:hypothetical protein
MSYLNSLRLHFFGQFQAAVSTVNNDPLHFNNAKFDPAYQKMETATHANGWWNPRGDANWRMIGCNITSAWLSDGQPAAVSDPVLTYLIADSDRSVAAKLVDLDPAQQGVSEIWGMEVRIADASGNTLMRAKYETAGFMDIFLRWPGGSGDGSAGAMYQSVLTDIKWGQIDKSRFLQQLQQASSEGLLSIKFNVDAFDANYLSPTFTLGRVAGTIGPATAAEPQHFVIGRHFMMTGLPSQGFFIPAGNVNFCEAVVDGKAGKIYLDLGNSLPTQSFGGPFTNIGALSIACATVDASGDTHMLPLGEVDYDYLAPKWYEKTAGVVALPHDRALTADELNTVAANPLVIRLGPVQPWQEPSAVWESPNGLYVRADKFVFRLNPGEDAEIHLYGSQYGQPYAGARVICYLDASGIGGGPPVGVPEDVLEFPRSVVLNEFGQAKVQVSARNPGNPRGYIDGQVYGIRCVLEDTLAPAVQYPFNPSEFVSLLVWDEFTADPPVWWGCLQPVFQQYANLYPLMQRFVDLSSYDSVTNPDNVVPLTITFGLDANDPNAMPVTRDLSGGKRSAILQWLATPGPDGKPLLGTPPVPPPAALEAVAAPAPAPFDPKSLGKVAFYKRVKAARQMRRKQ